MIYEADENELMNIVRSVNNHMNHVLNQFYSPYGLTRPQAIVLSEIERHGPVTVSLLAQRLGMTTSNLCLIAQRLEKSGFLKRNRDPEDQRSVILINTMKSHELIHQVQESVNEMIRQRLEYTDPENLDKIMEGLRLLNAVMMKQNQGDKACD